MALHSSRRQLFQKMSVSSVGIPLSAGGHHRAWPRPPRRSYRRPSPGSRPDRRRWPRSFRRSATGKVLHVGHQVVHGRAAHKGSVQVDPHHAAGIPEGAEHIVGEVAAVGHRARGIEWEATTGGGPAASRPKSRGRTGGTHRHICPAPPCGGGNPGPRLRQAAVRILGARAGEGVGVVPNRVQEADAPSLRRCIGFSSLQSSRSAPRC